MPIIELSRNMVFRQKNLYFLLAALLFVSCSRKIETEMPEAEQVIENFTAFESDAGKRIWDLNARKAYVQESENFVLAKDFKVRFYRKGWESSHSPGRKEEDIIDSVLTANSGKIDMQKNDFSTEGKTKVKTSDGETLECEDLRYVAEEKKIFTDSQFTLIRKDSVIKGTGLEATPDLSVVIVKNNRVVSTKGNEQKEVAVSSKTQPAGSK